MAAVQAWINLNINYGTNWVSTLCCTPADRTTPLPDVEFSQVFFKYIYTYIFLNGYLLLKMIQEVYKLEKKRLYFNCVPNTLGFLGVHIALT
jgi:hypothetical protein